MQTQTDRAVCVLERAQSDSDYIGTTTSTFGQCDCTRHTLAITQRHHFEFVSHTQLVIREERRSFDIDSQAFVSLQIGSHLVELCSFDKQAAFHSFVVHIGNHKSTVKV
jgi:hypothetical protein